MSNQNFDTLYKEGFYSRAQRAIEDPAYRNQLLEEKRHRLEEQENIKQKLKKLKLRKMQQRGGMYSRAQLVNFDDEDDGTEKMDQSKLQFDRTASEEYFSRAQLESSGRRYKPTFTYTSPRDEDEVLDDQRRKETTEVDYTLLEEAPINNEKGTDFPITGEGERANQGTDDMTEIFHSEFKRMCHEKKFAPISGYKPIAPPDYVLKNNPRKLKEIVQAEFNRMCKETKFTTARDYEPEHDPTHYAKTILKLWKKCPV
jgi:hypothetical protein